MTETGYRYRINFNERDLKRGGKNFRLFVDKARQLGPLKIKDAKFNRLLSEIEKANQSAIVAGVLDPEASRPASKGKATIGEVAGFQFFGTKTIPPRRPELENSRLRKLFLVSGLAISKGRPTSFIYGQLAEKVAGEMKEKIRAGIPPELLHREGTPLIDTGQLWGSIRGEVQEAIGAKVSSLQGRAHIRTGSRSNLRRRR